MIVRAELYRPAVTVAVTFNRGEIVFDASSSVGDEVITRYHSQMTGRQCRISVAFVIMVF